MTCYGEVHYVFVEVCDKLFPDIPKATIKSRMRNLGLSLMRAPQKVQDKLRSTRPHLAGYKVLSLISKRHVSILEAYQDSRTRQKQDLSKQYEHYSSVVSVVNNNSNYELERNCRRPTQLAHPSTNFLVENLLKNDTPVSSSHLHQSAGFSESQAPKPDNLASSESEFEPSSDCSEHSDSGSEQSSEESSLANDEDIVDLFRKKDLDVDLFPEIIKHLSAMKDFFQSDINFKRRQSKMSDVTWAKNVERLVIFFAYCARNLNLEPCLELVDNLKVVESFIKHIKHSRRVKSNTAALYVSSLIVAAKFMHSDDRCRNYDSIEAISDLRALQNQLNREHAIMESAKGPKRNKLFWPQFQELTRSLHQKYEEETDSKVKARLHMDFILLLLFAINPGRSKEFRTLRTAVNVPESQVDDVVRKLPNGENLIIFAENGVTRLVEKGFKTVKFYGSHVIEISEFEFVDFHLKRYTERSRPKLLSKGSTHDFFFVNRQGIPFNSASGFSYYVAKIFQQNLGFHCTINEMRHSLIENFRSSKDSADVHLAESLARACKHSLRTQMHIYDRRTQQERAKRAHHYLNQSAVNSIMDDPVPPSDSDDEDTNSQAERIPPAIGEMCALLPSDVQAKSPEIFLAKVLKYSPDGRTVRLAWFKEVDGHTNHYKFQVGHSVWEENVSSLIYPVDVFYNRLEGVYELRSSKEEIYQQLR